MSDRLFRSRDDRMLAGVAGGLAEMWDADPSLIRIGWALLAFFTGGLFLVVYVVMAIVVPEGEASPISPPAAATTTTDPVTGQLTTAAPVAFVDPAAARREARAVRRANRTGSGAPVGLILGGILIALGGFFLIREFLPAIDFDLFWPVALIGLGVILVVTQLGRDRGGSGGSPGSDGV